MPMLTKECVDVARKNDCHTRTLVMAWTRIQSFDVGLRHLAMCIMETDGTNWRIVDWRLIDCAELACVPEVNVNATPHETCSMIVLTALERVSDCVIVSPPPNIVYIERQPGNMQVKMRQVASSIKNWMHGKYLAKGASPPIEFVGGGVKLAAAYEALEKTPLKGPTMDTGREESRHQLNLKYKMDKAVGVEFVELILPRFQDHAKWSEMFASASTKRDDLADSLLQGYCQFLAKGIPVEDTGEPWYNIPKNLTKKSLEIRFPGIKWRSRTPSKKSKPKREIDDVSMKHSSMKHDSMKHDSMKHSSVGDVPGKVRPKKRGRELDDDVPLAKRG